MQATLTEHFSNADNASMRIDSASGVISGVKILGLVSRNGRIYPESTIRKALGLYEGASVNVNHPKGNAATPRDYQDRLGLLKNVTYREGQGAFADLHYNPKHSQAESLAWWAAHEPRAVGFSHNVEAVTARGKDGKLVIENITRVQSVDLVADPATTNGIHEAQDTEQTDMDLSTITLEQITASRPDLAAKIVEGYKNGEESKALAQKLKDAQIKLDALESEIKLGERKSAIEAKLAEAKLPASVVTDLFRQQLAEAVDDKAIDLLIADRQLIGKGQAAAIGRPRSKDQVAESKAEDTRPLAEVLRSGF